MKLVFQKKIAMKRKIYLFALLGLFWLQQLVRTTKRLCLS